MNWSDSSDCVDAYRTLPEPQKSLLDWLLDFLADVAKNSDKNKMTSQNLGIFSSNFCFCLTKRVFNLSFFQFFF